MLLFLRKFKYWRLHLHVHASRHFALAIRCYEHVGPFASLANHLINYLRRHSTVHLPSPLPLPSPFPLHFPCLPWSMVDYIFLHSTIPLFFVPPPPGPITSNVYMRNVKVKSWFVPLQSPFLFSRKLLIRSHIHVYFCWNVVYLFNKKLISLQCLQGEKWVSGFGFEVSSFTPSIFLKHMNHSKDPKKIDCFFMRLKP